LAIAAMKAGAFDFIEKPLRESALLESIERALHWNDRAYEERLERATLQTRLALLTPREREVFELVAAGEPNKVIGRHLGISFRTVELHRAHIIEKLQARSLSDLYGALRVKAFSIEFGGLPGSGVISCGTPAGSVAAITARWIDCRQFFEVEFGDCAQLFRRT
jgi:DNA-binding NarL/FixJ family response regulator